MTCRRASAACVAVVACVIATSLPSGAASSTTVIGATVPSATALDIAGCRGGTAGITDFGVVLPGTSAVTTADCQVTYGSSNDTAGLRIGQTDRGGVAMHAPSTGALDPGFGTLGIAEHSAGAGEVIEDVAIQGDGKVVLAGTRGNNVLVMRLTAAGALDATFGGGVREHDLGATETINSVAIDSTGRIVVAGQRNNDSLLVRLTSTGTLDTTFDGDGWRTYDVFVPDYDNLQAVAITNDGGILGVGRGWPDATTSMVKVGADGTPDPTFGTNGLRSLDICGACQEFPDGIDLLDDGRFVVASGGVTGTYEFLMSRHLANGALDPSFNGGGSHGWPVADGSASDVASLPDRRVILVGSGNSWSDVVIFRYTALGAFDTTFNGTGRRTIDLGATDRATGVVDYPDGSVLVSGTTGADVFLLRLLPSGANDTRFGTGGLVTVNAGGVDTVRAISDGLDGDIVIAGNSDDDAVAARLLSTKVADYVTGVTDWAPTGANLFGVCLDGVSVGTSAVWTADPDTCTSTNADPWRAVPTSTAAPGAKIAQTTVTNSLGATASMRFGFRPSSGQLPGIYVANVTFEVVAPNT